MVYRHETGLWNKLLEWELELKRLKTMKEYGFGENGMKKDKFRELEWKISE